MVVSEHRLDLDAPNKFFAIVPTVIYAKIDERLIGRHVAEHRHRSIQRINLSVG